MLYIVFFSTLYLALILYFVAETYAFAKENNKKLNILLNLLKYDKEADNSNAENRIINNVLTADINNTKASNNNII